LKVSGLHGELALAAILLLYLCVMIKVMFSVRRLTYLTVFSHYPAISTYMASQLIRQTDRQCLSLLEPNLVTLLITFAGLRNGSLRMAVVHHELASSSSLGQVKILLVRFSFQRKKSITIQNMLI
jgi:hypothetical protein